MKRSDQNTQLQVHKNRVISIQTGGIIDIIIGPGVTNNAKSLMFAIEQLMKPNQGQKLDYLVNSKS